MWHPARIYNNVTALLDARTLSPLNSQKRVIETANPNSKSQKAHNFSDVDIIIIFKDCMETAFAAGVDASVEELVSHVCGVTAWFVGYVFLALQTAVALLKSPSTLLVIMLYVLPYALGQTVSPATNLSSTSSSTQFYAGPQSYDRVRGHGVSRHGHPDSERLMDAQAGMFEQLLGDMARNESLGLLLEMTIAGHAAHRLAAAVRLGGLPARHAIANGLTEVGKVAKQTSVGLLKLNMEIKRALRRVVTCIEVALHRLHNSNTETASSHSSDAVLSDTFNLLLEVFSNNIKQLIHEANCSLVHLDTLQTPLTALHTLVEESSVPSSPSPWTSALPVASAEAEKIVGLLRDMDKYDRHARARVVKALLVLQAADREAEAMRKGADLGGGSSS